MECEPQTVDELRARYLAVKKRLGGVAGPTGVVPIERVNLPHALVKDQRPVSLWAVRLPCQKFTAMLREVAEMHGLDPEIVKSQTLKQNVLKVRQELFYRAKNELKLGYSQIGHLMHTTHSTVIYGYKRHEKRLAQGAKML
jgi:hypothetical protein